MTHKQAIDDIANDCWQIADEHGWHEGQRTFGDYIALIHSEASEALEAFRHHDMDEVPEELADICIRVFDMAIDLDIDIADAILKKMEINRGRSYRHGGKAL